MGLGEDILSRKKPANLAVLNDKEIVDIAAGGMHNMALTKDGKVYDRFLLIQTPKAFSAINCGL